MVTDADLYRRSTQYRFWSFSQPELDKKLREPNERIPRTENALTYEEERLLILYVAGVQAATIVQEFRLPTQVRATAVSFFRKFFMRYSVMEFHPKMVLCTAVFLAAKSENTFISISKFCEMLDKIDRQEILDLEFRVFEALNFSLTVHNALLPLHGFYLDMQSQLTEEEHLRHLGELHDRAREVVVNAFVSDAVFLYTPSHIALAALLEVNESLTRTYLSLSLEREPERVERVLAHATECRALLRVEMPSKEACRAISKKLNAYFNSSGEPERKRQRPN